MSRPLRFMTNPFVVLAFETLFVTASETLLKIGAAETAAMHGAEWTGVAGLGSIWIWCAIALVISSFLCWIYVLRHVPLSVAFPLSNVVHVFVPLSSWIFLHEYLSPRRWCGIAIVVLGLIVVARPVAKIEEKL